MNDRAARIGRNLPPGALPPPLTDEEREQWSTLCSITTDVGLCPQPAVDPSAVVKICQVHIGIVFSETITRLRAQFETDNEEHDPTTQGEENSDGTR